MDCKEFKEKMVLLADEKDNNKKSEFIEHWKNCSNCAIEYKDLKSAVNLLKNKEIFNPDTEKLVLFARNELNEPKIGLHLKTCQECNNIVNIIKSQSEELIEAPQSSEVLLP